MGFFSTILEKLGMGSAAAAPVIVAAKPIPASVAPTAPAAAPVVNPVAMVDVVSQLEQRAAANPQKLNWRTSIVDLLKLLDMDSSLEQRKALAKELFCPDELMGDSAKMNMCRAVKDYFSTPPGAVARSDAAANNYPAHSLETTAARHPPTAQCPARKNFAVRADGGRNSAADETRAPHRKLSPSRPRPNGSDA